MKMLKFVLIISMVVYWFRRGRYINAFFLSLQ